MIIAAAAKQKKVFCFFFSKKKNPLSIHKIKAKKTFMSLEAREWPCVAGIV